MLCKKLPACCRPLLLCCTLFLAGVPLYAQSIGPATLDATGNSITAGGIMYEYAIGQLIADNTFISPLLVVTPGVIQPDLNTTGISPDAISPAQLQVYPAPVETLLFIQPAFRIGGKLRFGLYDAAGKLVLRQEAVLKTGGERQTMDVAQFAAGQYTLQVSWLSAGNTYTAGYKVQKLQ